MLPRCPGGGKKKMVKSKKLLLLPKTKSTKSSRKKNYPWEGRIPVLDSSKKQTKIEGPVMNLKLYLN